MRYLSFEWEGRPRIGVLDGAAVRPIEGTNALVPESEGALREQRLGPPIERAGLRLLPASPRASRIFCVGLNYDEHILETGREKPEYPVLFPKFASNLVGPEDDILLPAESAQIDYEGELAVVIGRAGRRISEESALQHVFGFAVANDVTVRDYQYKTHQWLQGKAWDRSTPLSAEIVSPESLDLATSGIRTLLNGQTVQSSTLDHLIFTVPRLIALLSVFTRLECGDVILTGTPGGVGYRRDPQLFIQPGDEVVVEVDGVGRLANRARSETP